MATVLGNLIQNGVDAAVSSPRAEGGAPWVQVVIRQPGSMVEIAVRDSGPGGDSTIATEVFEHGFTTKAAQDGERGIGLALTRLICRRRGGEVEIRKYRRRGRVRCPDDRHPRPIPGRTRQHQHGWCSMITVLVVDDDFRVARIHSAFVDRVEGFRTVGVAHNGAEALAAGRT